MKEIIKPFLFLPFFYLNAFAQNYIDCQYDRVRLALRSIELQEIVQADQDDRLPPIDWQRVLPRDEARRKRVSEIFGEGCFKEAKDYAAAALVFQHGNIPDHFFQTFLWAKKAVELGDSNQKWLMALGIDRYLVNIKHKQLFGTQASKPNNEACWCLESVETSFPNDLRKEYTGKKITDQLLWVNSLNSNGQNCGKAQFCTRPFLNSPSGTVPGFW